MNTIVLTGNDLTLEQIGYAAHHEDVHITIDEHTRERIARSRLFVDEAVDRGDVIYGLTTGFGFFKNVTISKEQTKDLQRNLIMSHAVGVGEPLSRAEARAMMLVRINSLVKGYSGVRQVVIDTLLAFLNKGVHPFVPRKGSLGASGDLSPLAHMTLVMMGMGEAFVDGKRAPAVDALSANEIVPITLSSKEGLALTNGTSMMAGVGTLNLLQAEELSKIADIAAAMSVEGLMGSVTPYDQPIHDARPHRGQSDCSANVRRMCESSPIIASHEGCDRIQDAYSLRCTPQVHGAVRDTLAHVRLTLEIEVNSATDNPLIFPDEGLSRSAGNFHGEPIAFVMDFLTIAVSELANIAERRIAKFVDQSTSEGLPPFLVPREEAGVSSGFMILQYTAAALTSENKTYAHPSSVDSIPTSANQEDHVSMGANATNKAALVLENVKSVLAIELLTATQSLDFKKPLIPGAGSKAAYDHVRQHIPFLEKDRVLYPDIERVNAMLEDHSLLASVERVVGPLL